MNAPEIQISDIRKGDTIRTEFPKVSDHIQIAVEFVARMDGGVPSVAFEHGSTYYLLDRPTPAVAVVLPSMPTLGWITTLITPRQLGVVGVKRGHPEGVNERYVRYLTGGWNRQAEIDAFTEAVAVPKAALDKLRTTAARARGADRGVAVDAFLAELTEVDE